MFIKFCNYVYVNENIFGHMTYESGKKHGTCDSRTGTCICEPGWTGLDCGVKACPKKCSGHGRCEGGKCKCWGKDSKFKFVSLVGFDHYGISNFLY